MQLFVIAFCGACGVLARYLIDLHMGPANAEVFPVSTFLINCAGSFLIGVAFVISSEMLLGKEISVPLTVGFLGGFTTFSAFSMQTLQLLERGKFTTAISYFVGSPVAGLACAFVGVFLARTFCGAT